MATKNKSAWLLIVFILAGIVLGGLLGELVGNVNGLWWLSYGQSFGFSTPFELDLNIIKLTFGLMIKINVASIIGIAVALLIYRKV